MTYNPETGQFYTHAMFSHVISKSAFGAIISCEKWVSAAAILESGIRPGVWFLRPYWGDGLVFTNIDTLQVQLSTLMPG